MATDQILEETIAVAPAADAILKVVDLHAGYGQSEVLHGLNVKVAPNEIVAIMGQPGRLAARIPIAAERPRRRNDPYIADLVTRVRLELLEPPTA